MEMIENYMVIPRVELKFKSDDEYEADLEQSDRDYEDRIFEKLVGD